MIEYLLATDEQRELAETAGRILARELGPRLGELEAANGGLGMYPMDVANVLSDAGYHGLNIPEEWGGLGLDIVSLCLICEEMSKVDAGFAFNYINSGLYFNYLVESHLSREEKQAYADRILAGKSSGAFCLTESFSGNDPSMNRTAAVKDGDGWVINGTKCFVTNGNQADHYFVIAWTDKEKGLGKGMTMFLVERERGVQIGKLERKMGFKLSETCDVIFDHVRVPDDHVCGAVGEGFRLGLSNVAQSRATGMSFNLGIAQAALDHAAKYALERVTWGKPIIDHEGHGFLLADMKARTDASRAMVYYAAECIKKGIDISSLTSTTKFFVSDATMQTTTDAVQALGGYGYMHDYPVEKLMRDAKVFQIFDGTNQVNRWNAAKWIKKEYSART